MNTNIKQNNIYICADCNGSGMVNNRRCRQCEGFGAVLLIGSKIYYWGKKYSLLNINHEARVRKIRVMINAVFFLFGIAGFLCLLKVFYDFHIGGFGINYFIEIRNDYSLLFWISLLTDTYLIYRISRESKLKRYIRARRVYRLDNIKGQVDFSWDQIRKYKKIDISKSFDVYSLEIISDAWKLAHKLGHSYVDGIHLMAMMFSSVQARLIFSRLAVDYKKLSQKIKSGLNKITESGKTRINLTARQILLQAYSRAYNSKKAKVTTTDLVYSMAIIDGLAKDLLYDLSITESEISHVAEWVDLSRNLIKRWRRGKYKAYFKPKNKMNRAYTAIATPNLNQISHDMTLFARSGVYAPAIGRRKEIKEIFRVLEVDKVGAVLVGFPGVGKKTIIEAIAELMVEEDVPHILQDKRLVSLSISGLIAGASRTGDLERRILTVMSEISRSKNIVLVIEDIHHIVGAGRGGSQNMDAAEVLSEQMQASNFLVLATTTPDFYATDLQKTSLGKVLQKITVDEPDTDESIVILEAKALEIEAQHKVYFSYQAIEQAVKLSGRYMRDNYLPEKAIKLIEEAALSVSELKGERSVVSSDDVANVVSEQTSIPVAKIARSEREKLLNLEQRIHERVVGQDQAVNFVASALRRARTDIREENRPIASFLFLGPTGVGKTEVAKTLAEVYFGSEKNMVRADMSEYQGSDALAKLIGYAGGRGGGYLSEAVKKNPFSLVLLDEIEKANFDILNVFLQVLDDGRLTDALGKTIDFTNSIIIATSNAGSGFIQEQIKQGKSIEVIREVLVSQYLKDKFRPELLNRFDAIIVFHPLQLNDVSQITSLFLNKLKLRLEQKGIEFLYNNEAVEKLSKLGFDPSMGARPLRRVIQDKVEDQLAKLLLAKQVDRRDKVILNGDLILSVEPAEKI